MSDILLLQHLRKTILAHHVVNSARLSRNLYFNPLGRCTLFSTKALSTLPASTKSNFLTFSKIRMSSTLLIVESNSIYNPHVMSFSISSVLYKKKRNFRYDPNYVSPVKATKKNKLQAAAAVARTTPPAPKKFDNTLVRMNPEELEIEDKLDEPVLLDDDTILECIKRNNLNRSGIITEEAAYSLKQLVNKFPRLKHVDSNLLTQYLECMTAFGFRPMQAVEMIIIHPTILTNFEKKLSDSLLTWRSLGYVEKDILTLHHLFPQIVDIASLDIRTRFSFLASYFTIRETTYAIINCIEILYEHEGVLRAKLDYLIKTVCHSTKYVINSNVLSYPLKLIDLRHEFLVRAGLFQLDNYYQFHKKMYMLNPRIERDRYFPPEDVVCTSDKEFLRRCTDNRLTLNELAAFEELYEKEKEREALLLSDDEDEEADDSDDDEEQRGSRKHLHLSPVQGDNNSSAFFNKKDASDFYY